MRFIVVVVTLLTSTADAQVLGLRFGMTAVEVKAAKPCKAPVANAAKASLTCKAIAFAGTKMDAELWVPRAGLARIGLTTRIGTRRSDAEPAADAILAKVMADYGPLDMLGVGELVSSAALFDNTDRTFTRMKGKLKAASMFTAKQPPDNSRLIGKVLRDRNGYVLELSFVP